MLRPAREVFDIAGEESLNWYVDQGPAICEERAALLDKSRLKTFRIPDPLGGGRMHDRIKAIQIMHQEFGGEVQIVGWVEGPLALGAELRGLNHTMTAFVDDPDFIDDLLEFTAEVARVYAEAQIQAGADAIGMSERRPAWRCGPALLQPGFSPPAIGRGGVDSQGAS